MKHAYLLFIGIILLSCNSQNKNIEPDRSKHVGLTQLNSNYAFKTLHSGGEIAHAMKQSELVDEAYQFLSEIMGPKKQFCLLVISGKDWNKNAYSPVIGMPEYYRGNLIVGAGQNDMASGFEELIMSFPKEMTKNLTDTYTNDLGTFDLRLFFDKLSIHELTHSFQDPKNQEGYSMSRWLEEIHANMGLYAFYKTKKPSELKYIMSFVDFNLGNPPPDLQYTSLSDFDAHYYEMSPSNYGHYQMKFTGAAKEVIDSLGNGILKPLNDFIIKYDETWKEKITKEDFKNRLATEVDPFLLEIIENW
ncbi:hypothetical protein ABN763_13145 [Spongiivirga sp. MCCC 1A20706]|uniref:hypothetical protein n=1 Tax=Spongiivirga sp. MCCC 1A20706 TaxID=3160963 RepID=UPI0039777B5F